MRPDDDLPERPVPVKPPPPVKVLHQVMRSAAQEINAARGHREAGAAHQRFCTLATDIALVRHQMRGFLDRQEEQLRAAGLDGQADLLATLDRKLVKALEGAGVQIIDPVGEPFRAVADHIDVRGGAPGDEETLVVGRTLSPGLRLDDGELIRPAQVILGTETAPAHSHSHGEGNSR
ncbi:hypothetical protein [Actinomadura chokoriensis]|uniref:Nucleotide exchange factor GrpE n=1 Tax=Actinomadura chokoriensis TaxID=454156 RepID=A0ABV4R209_9ACTN